MKQQVLKPHYRKGNRYFFRHKKQKMVLEKIAPQHYIASGNIIQDKTLQLVTDETVDYENVVIEVK